MIWTVNFKLERMERALQMGQQNAIKYSIYTDMGIEELEYTYETTHSHMVKSNWKRLHRWDFSAIYLLLRQVPR